MSESLFWALLLGAIILILGLVEGIAEWVIRSTARDQAPQATWGLTGKGAFLFVACWNAPFVYAIWHFLKGWGFLPMHKVLGLLCVSTFALFVLMLGSSFSPRIQRVLFKPKANTAQTP